MGLHGKVSIPRQLHATKRHFTESNLKIRTLLQSTKVTPHKHFAEATKPLSKFDRFESAVATKRRNVPSESITGIPAVEPQHESIVKRSVTQTPRSQNWMSTTASRGRRTVVPRRRRRTSRRRVSRRTRRRTTAKPTIIPPTNNRPYVTVSPKDHPCNTGKTSSAMKYRVNGIECRRWRTSELEQRFNCLGKFNHRYLAASWKEALKFRNLDTGRNLDFSRSFVLNRSSRRIKKRGVDVDPGETMIVQCYAAKTPTETGNLRMCPVCTAITRQPSQPRRFPEYINELVCDPNSKSNYIAGIDAFCVQKTFTIELLQFNDEWEKNPTLSAEAGHDVYTEKWEPYTQEIKRHCACELLPSSELTKLL